MVTISDEPRAYQWALPEGLDLPPDELQVRLDFYRDAVVMHLLDDGTITTRMVSARDITLALLKEVPLSSGMLPEGALWWRQSRRGAEVALWRPPRIWTVALETEPLKPAKRLRLPMVGLVFICSPGKPPSVYAAKKKPRRPQDHIYHAPLFNLFRDGSSCPGTHNYPVDIGEIPESFFLSFFSPTGEDKGRSKKYPTSLLKLWQHLDGKKRYPLGDLVQLGTVEDILK